MDDIEFMVRVSCMTYNHAHYIEDAMNGFTMQETNFPFVCTIVDDASTDGEQEVIRKYFEEHFDLQNKSVVRSEDTDDYTLTFARHKTNINCYFSVLFLKYNHHSLKKSKKTYLKEWIDTKYTAYCEGDDYWIDAKKLQIQVDFLEQNPDFIVCSHRFWIKDERNKENAELVEYRDYNRIQFVEQNGVCGYEYNHNNYWDFWYTQPLSIVLRNGDYINQIPISKYKYYRDVIQYYYVLKQGKGMLLKDQMGVYRKNNGGIFAGNSLIDNVRITNDNLRTIYVLEKDSTVLPVLYDNTIFLMKEAIKHKQIKEFAITIKTLIEILPFLQKIRFFFLMLIEPFKTIQRKLTK